MNYNITLTRKEISMIGYVLLTVGRRLAPDRPERLQMEAIYKKIFDAAANEDIAQAMQAEGDKYGHD